MGTTIQISKDLQKVLQVRKMSDKESYEKVIWDLLEDSMEVSAEAKKDIEESSRQVKVGKFKTLAQVKKELGL